MDNIQKSIDFAFATLAMAKSLPNTQRALLGEIGIEKITPLSSPPERIIQSCKEFFADVKKEDIKLYFDGKEVKESE